MEADTGNIGGSSSHEFQVLTETGEDALVACDTCDYAANVEQAVARHVAVKPNPTAPVKKVATPGKHTIAEVSGFFGVPPEKLVKTLIYLANGKPVAVMVRGDRDVNEIKLANALGISQSSVVKFSQKLGFRGYPDLKYAVGEAVSRVTRTALTLGGAHAIFKPSRLEQLFRDGALAPIQPPPADYCLWNMGIHELDLDPADVLPPMKLQ